MEANAIRIASLSSSVDLYLFWATFCLMNPYSALAQDKDQDFGAVTPEPPANAAIHGQSTCL
jgi:hypothetical protein